MSREEIIALLREELKVEVEFEAYHYGRENRLTVTLKIGDEVLSESSCRVEPTEGDPY